MHSIDEDCVQFFAIDRNSPRKISEPFITFPAAEIVSFAVAAVAELELELLQDDDEPDEPDEDPDELDEPDADPDELDEPDADPDELDEDSDEPDELSKILPLEINELN